MAYDNLTNVTTSTSGTWTGTPFSYSGIALESGIPHKDQLEVERIFTLPSSPTNVAAGISLYDLHRVFVINKNEYTVNETTSTITAMTVASTPRNYVTQVATPTVPAGTSIAIPVSTNNDSIVIRRKTFSSGKYVTWSAGTRLTSEQLNLQVNQLIKINQELIYKLESEYLRGTDVTGSSAPAFGVNNNLDMQGHQIVNLSDPSSPNDAVNINYANANYVRVGGAAAQTITGAKTFSGAALFQNTVTADSTLLVTGMTTLNGGLTMDTNKFTVADTTGNTSIGGTLAVTGVTGIIGNTGIGLATAVPNTNVTKALHIHSTDTTNRVAELRLTNATTTSAANTGFAIQEAVNSAYLWNFSAGPISIGTDNTERIVIPSDASGIRFPASPTLSGNVNTLDAYEEGSWTPVFTGLTRTDGIVAGRYTRIGRVIILQMAVLNATFTGTGTGDITGCPAALNPGMRTSSALLWQDSFSNITTNNTVYWFFGTDGAMGFYRNSVSGVNWLLTPITAGSGRYLHGTLVYTL